MMFKKVICLAWSFSALLRAILWEYFQASFIPPFSSEGPVRECYSKKCWVRLLWTKLGFKLGVTFTVNGRIRIRLRVELELVGVNGQVDGVKVSLVLLNP